MKQFDIAVVGAGPGGASAAYYTSEMGFSVVLLDKQTFPRRKICGDAITLRAQNHLKRMGVLQEILDEKKGGRAAMGGLVSPSGIAYIGDSAEELGSHLVLSIKREIMDEKVAQAAVGKGADFKDGFNVIDVLYDDTTMLWRIIGSDREEIQATMLIAADGASSLLARSLGIVKDPAEAVCSSVYIKAGTHSFEHDGIVFYPDFLLPGYAALFKEADGDVVFCCYIIPGGTAKPSDLKELHNRILKEYKPVTASIGPNAQIETMKAAPLRLGGEAITYADQVLVVGDAAGQIDPLTGEGIQYAMDAGEIAAVTIKEAFEKKNFTASFLRNYQEEWKKSFGSDFGWSSRMASISSKKPVFLDAFASLCKKRGDAFMTQWGMIMTGSKPKRHFFKPKLAIPLAAEVMRLRAERKKENDTVWRS